MVEVGRRKNCLCEYFAVKRSALPLLLKDLEANIDGKRKSKLMPGNEDILYV